MTLYPFAHIRCGPISNSVCLKSNVTAPLKKSIGESERERVGEWEMENTLSCIVTAFSPANIVWNVHRGLISPVWRFGHAGKPAEGFEQTWLTASPKTPD